MIIFDRDKVLGNIELPLSVLNEDMYLHTLIHPLISIMTRDLDFLMLHSPQAITRIFSSITVESRFWIHRVWKLCPIGNTIFDGKGS
jgi:hypothetical protein